MVDELAATYARILASVWSMRVFDRQSFDYATLDSDADTKLVRMLGRPGLVLWPLRLLFHPMRGWWRTFMLRPVISLFVNRHINSSASRLSSVLVRERLKMLHASDPEVESLDQSIAMLGRLRGATTGRIALLLVLRFVPLIGVLFSAGIVTVSFTLSDAPDLINLLIALLSLFVLLIHPVAVQFGFRWKRALLAGGGGEAATDPGELPTACTYEIEILTYGRLGVKRSTEFPVDLFLAPGFYFLLSVIIGLALDALTIIDEGSSTTQTVVNDAAFAVFVVFFAIATFRLALRYRRRRALGLI